MRCRTTFARAPAHCDPLILKSKKKGFGDTFCQISLKRTNRYLWKFHKFGISGIPTHIQNIYTPILLNLEKIDKCPSMSRKKHKIEFYSQGIYRWPKISSSRFSIPIDINSCKKIFLTYLIFSHICRFVKLDFVSIWVDSNDVRQKTHIIEFYRQGICIWPKLFSPNVIKSIDINSCKKIIWK